MDHTDPRRFGVDHQIVGKTVIHPDTGKPALVTRCVMTRFGVLAQLNGDGQRAWLPNSLKEVN